MDGLEFPPKGERSANGFFDAEIQPNLTKRLNRLFTQLIGLCNPDNTAIAIHRLENKQYRRFHAHSCFATASGQAHYCTPSHCATADQCPDTFKDFSLEVVKLV